MKGRGSRKERKKERDRERILLVTDVPLVRKHLLPVLELHVLVVERPTQGSHEI